MALLMGGALGALGLGAGYASWTTPAEADAVAAPPPVAATAPSVGTTPPPMIPAARHDFLDAEQWARLQEAVAHQSDPDGETARILDFLAYQRTVQRFRAERAAHPGAPTPELLALARDIDAGLDSRWARGEVSGPEAQHIKAGLLELLQPDADQRARDLAAWREAQAAIRPRQVDPRDAQLLQAQRALVTRWRQEAPPGASPDELVAQLDSLRQRIYASPTTPQGNPP